MRRITVDRFILLMALGVAVHLGTLFISAYAFRASLVVIISVCALFLTMLCAVKTIFEHRLKRKLSHDNDVELQKRQMAGAHSLSEKTLEQEKAIYGIHHDINNHLSVAISMLSDGATGDAAKYIEQLRRGLGSEALK